jgi:transaldolase
MNRMERLGEIGQSAWLDFIDHALLSSGELKRLIESEGVSGVTSNPTIFHKAIAGSGDYDQVIAAAAPSETDAALLERLMVKDITLACDALRPVYDRSAGADGFASIEVAPSLAGDVAASVEQAVRLWSAVGRPNLLVKIPGTRAALPAIESCLTHGIGINITLLFSVPRYRQVIEAYLHALERRVAANEPIDKIASVASFFVSRVDTKVDGALDALPEHRRARASKLRGRIAVANAKLAYAELSRVLASDRWKALAARGARPQRLLWASTSPKDAAYGDLHYVAPLVGAHTIDTMTPATLRAFLDHGEPEARLARDVDQAREQLAALAALGIDLGELTEQLEAEGVRSFADSFERTLKSVAEKRGRAEVQPRA